MSENRNSRGGRLLAHTRHRKKEVPTHDANADILAMTEGVSLVWPCAASTTGKGEVEEADPWGSAVLDECGGGGMLQSS